MVDSAINRALINEAGVLSNTVFNAVARTFKEGQLPPNYVGPAHHQPESPVVTAPSATTAAAGVETTSPPSTLGVTDVLSTSTMANPSTSDGQIKLATDLLASAMSGSVPRNWWGYGIPPEMMLKTPGISQTADVTGKAPMASAPPNLPMNQSPQYTTTTTTRPYTGNSQAPMFQMPNVSADSMSMQQRFMTQPGYVNSMMMPNLQPSAGFMPMNANSGWTGQPVFPQMPQENHQAPGFQQGQIQPRFQNQGLINQPMNLGQQIGGQTVNPMFHADRAPQRHMEVYQQVPDPQSPHRQDADAYWADKIAEVMRDQFGIKPKVNTYSYRTPYPPAYDLIPLPNRYKVPDFTEFSGQDDTSTMEHVNIFIIQCGEASNRDKLRVRLFSSSLSGSAFTWFISLPPNSVITWVDLEKQFHKYFFSGVHEKKITDLVRLKQRNDESVESFVQMLREVKNKCYSLVLDDRQLADLDFQGLLPHIRDKYASQEFESLSHLVQRISDQDIKPFEPKRAWNKKVSFVDEAASSDSDEEPVIGLAEWVKNKKPMSCPFGHKEPEKFAFDVTKADRIFDFLLQEGQIKLSPNHVIPSAKELRKMKYWKWHNATSHSTNECKVFKQQLQSAIESGRIKFDNSKTQKPMKIDQHPFPTNMLDAKGKTKVLTSEAAERSASVDPQHQITATDAKGKGLIQEGTSSGRLP